MSNNANAVTGMTSQASKSPSSSKPEQQELLRDILTELRDLNASTLAQARLNLQPPSKKDFVWTCLLQAFALVIGVLFGVFAILAWVAAKQANSLANDSTNLAGGANCLANTANTIALLSFCASNTNASIASICASFQSTALGTNEEAFSSLAFSVQSNGFSCNGGDNSGSSSSLSATGPIAGGVIGGIIGAVLLYYLTRLASQRYGEKVLAAKKLEESMLAASSTTQSMACMTRVPTLPDSQEKARIITKHEAPRGQV